MKDYVRAYEGNESYIFVSYAHLDSDKVLPIIRELYERKYRVWYDEGIAPGTEWPENIERHLLGADTVLVFVSAHSLASKNCKNEVRAAAGQKVEKETPPDDENAKKSAHKLRKAKRRYDLNRRRKTNKRKDTDQQEKKIVTVSLDGVALTDEIPGQTALHYDDGHVIEVLSDGGILSQELIGDGVSGYAYEIVKRKQFNVWNLWLGVAAVLICALLYSLLGLYTGKFDDYLPAKQVLIEQTEPTAQPKEETVSISETMIGSVLPVTFSSDMERNAVYEVLGWSGTSAMTYRDLNEMEQVAQLDLTGRPITDLSFAAYLPNLEWLTLCETQVTDLTPLSGCPKLKTVQVTANMLPLSIATDQAFELEVI